jgi:hypothetical protein
MEKDQEMSDWSIPFVEYSLKGKGQYEVNDVASHTVRKVEKTAVELCALIGLVFLRVKREIVKTQVEVTRGVFKKREVKEDKFEKMVYHLHCRGTEEQKDQMIIAKQAVIIGSKFLRNW